MSNIDQLKRCFKEALALPANTVIEELAYQDHPSWDSVGHMRLITVIESTFDIMLTTDEVLDLNDFNKAREIVGNHGVSLVA